MSRHEPARTAATQLNFSHWAAVRILFYFLFWYDMRSIENWSFEKGVLCFGRLVLFGRCLPRALVKKGEGRKGSLSADLESQISSGVQTPWFFLASPSILSLIYN